MAGGEGFDRSDVDDLGTVFEETAGGIDVEPLEGRRFWAVHNGAATVHLTQAEEVGRVAPEPVEEQRDERVLPEGGEQGLAVLLAPAA